MAGERREQEGRREERREGSLPLPTWVVEEFPALHTFVQRGLLEVGITSPDQKIITISADATDNAEEHAFVSITEEQLRAAIQESGVQPFSFFTFLFGYLNNLSQRGIVEVKPENLGQSIQQHRAAIEVEYEQMAADIR